MEELEAKKKKRAANVFRVIVLILLAYVIASFLLQGQSEEVFRQIKDIGWMCAFGLIAVQALFIICDSETIYLFARCYKKGYKFMQSIEVYLHGLFYRGVTFGSGTKFAQMYYMSKQDIPAGTSSAMLSLQYMFHKLAIIVIAVGLSLIVSPFEVFHLGNSFSELFGGINVEIIIKLVFIAGVVINLVTVLVSLLICTWKKFHRCLLAIIGFLLNIIKLKDRFYPMIDKYFTELEEECRYFRRHYKVFIWELILSCIKLLIGYTLPYIIYIGLTGDVPDSSLLQIICLTSLTQFLVGIIPVPLGMGSTEAIFLLLFTSTFGETMVTSAMIVYRVITFYLPFVASIFYVGVLNLRIKILEHNNAY